MALAVEHDDAARRGAIDPPLCHVPLDRLVDTLLPSIVPSFFGGGAYNIFLTRQFYLTIPRDFDEAARIDSTA